MWQISNLDNTVSLTKTQALTLANNKKFLLKLQGHLPKFENEEEKLNALFTKNGKNFSLYFDPDHMEHMDYIPEFLKELKSLKIKGDITFGSEEGDNAGSYWGYRFDGNGGMKNLQGHIEFVEVD